MFYFYFLVELQFELKPLQSQSKCSSAGTTHFALVVLEMGSLELFTGPGLEPGSS
jgi:hypothetical protein